MKYEHSESIHNLNAPNHIVPLLVKIFQPKSVIDVGCGVGTFLHVFKKLGVENVLGIDGSWVDKELLLKYLNKDEFREINLEGSFRVENKYDLAVCLEVAEHISEEKSNYFIENLTLASDIIIFSAAVPMQGGQNHLNEQWIDYWQLKFASHNYTFYDGLRQILWDNKHIETWYKQNIFIVAKSGIEIRIDADIFSEIKPMQTYIHPDFFLIYANAYHNFYEESLKTSIYLKLLIKSIFRKFKVNI